MDFKRVGIWFKQHSPEILTGLGIGCMSGAVVFAIKQTPKCQEIKQQKEDELKAVDECLAMNDVKYTDADAKRDLRIIKTKAAVNTIKVYSPTIALFVVGTSLILTGFGILRKRNTILASVGLLATDKLNKYRKRVAEKYGDDIEKELYYGIKELTAEKEDEKGKKKSEKIKAMDNDLVEHDIYCRFFDETSGLWDNYNGLQMHKILVMNAQKYCNQLIKSRVVYDKNDKVRKPGYLYLNEAYDALGMTKSDVGHHIGWLYNPEEDGPIDDTHRYIDFGLFRDDQATRDFMNNKEKTVLLDFNVDGPISPYAYKTIDEINKIKNGGKNK